MYDNMSSQITKKHKTITTVNRLIWMYAFRYGKFLQWKVYIWNDIKGFLLLFDIVAKCTNCLKYLNSDSWMNSSLVFYLIVILGPVPLASIESLLHTQKPRSCPRTSDSIYAWATHPIHVCAHYNLGSNHLTQYNFLIWEIHKIYKYILLILHFSSQKYRIYTSFGLMSSSFLWVTQYIRQASFVKKCHMESLRFLILCHNQFSYLIGLR